MPSWVDLHVQPVQTAGRPWPCRPRVTHTSLYYLIIAKLWKFTFKAILWCGFCMISSAKNTVALSYFFSVVYGPHVPNSDALTVVTSGTGVNATATCMHESG